MRQKEKEAVIDLEIMLQIKNEFPKLMDFYKYAGLNMPRQEFYAVMRGDECHPGSVQAVELGCNKAREIRDMPVQKMLQILCDSQKTISKQQPSSVLMQALRAVVARLYM